MELKANERKIINTQPLDYLFTQGESGVDRIPIILPLQYGQVDLSALRWSIQLVSEQDTFVSKPLFSEVGPDTLTVYWEVDEDCTAVAGKIGLTVVGISDSGNEVIKFDGREIMVKAALYGNFVPSPDTLTASLAQVQKYAEETILAARKTDSWAAAAEKSAQDAKAVAENGPLIGENGHWFLYDAASGSHLDSGVSVYGEEGKSPYIGTDGYWYQWNREESVYQKTDIFAQGPPGVAGGIQSVNGILPDGSGNVEVAAGIGRNLLLNWHFVHPVNQREVTAYHNPDTGAIGYHGENIYSIDRWRIHGIWLTLTDEGIELDRISAGTAGRAVQQLEESVAKQLSGREMTISALIDGELYTSSFLVPNAEGSLGETVVPTGKMRLYYHPSGTAQFTFDVEPGSQGHILQAAKLEFGSRQTLAHRDEGGEWVLNEIPDYGEELARCQRYAMMYEANGNTLLFMGYGLVDGQFRFTAQTPVVMRIKPTVLKSGLNAASIIDSEGLKSIDTLAVKATSGNTLLLDGMTSIAKAGSIYYLHAVSGNWLLLDAEIY